MLRKWTDSKCANLELNDWNIIWGYFALPFTPSDKSKAGKSLSGIFNPPMRPQLWTEQFSLTSILLLFTEGREQAGYAFYGLIIKDT